MFENCIIKPSKEDPNNQLINQARAKLINQLMIDTDKAHYQRVGDLL